jgi:hypothetical protein
MHFFGAMHRVTHIRSACLARFQDGQTIATEAASEQARWLKAGRPAGRPDGRMAGWPDGRMDGWMDG